MICLINNPDEIDKYKRLMLMRSGSADCPVLFMQQDLFKEARQLFNTGEIYLIAVLKDGKVSVEEQNCIFFSDK